METLKQPVHCCNYQCIKHTTTHLFFMKSKLKQQQIHVSRVVTVTKHCDRLKLCIRKETPLHLDCHISLNDKLNWLGILIHLRTAVLSRGKKLINFGRQTMFRLVVCSNLRDELTLFITVSWIYLSVLCQTMKIY